MKKSILTIAITMISTLTILSQSWTQSANGLGFYVNSLYTDAASNILYATGVSTTTATYKPGFVAYLSGSNWTTITSYSTTGVAGNCFAGNSILSYSSGMVPQTLIVCSDKVYSYQSGVWTARSAGGNFTASVVDSLNDYLYVAGYTGTFSTPYKIYKYDLTDLTIAPITYTSSNFPLSTSGGKINDLEILNNVLYISEENSPASLMQLDIALSTITTVGTPVAVNSKCLSVYANQLYVTGNFTGFDGNTSNNLTSTSGTSFQDFGSLLSGTALGQHQMYNGKMYVTNSANTLVKVVTGTTIATPIVSTYPMTTTGSINTFAVYNGDLYAGGTFSVSTGGSTYFANIAKYNSSVATVLNNIQSTKTVNIYPNPFTNNLTVDFENSYILDVFDYTGRKIKTINCNGKTEITLEHSGIYFIEVNNENTHFIEKVVKE